MFGLRSGAHLGPSASQKERITLIKLALLNKVGEGGMKHYGLDDPPPPASTLTQRAEDTTIREGDSSDDAGVYL
jgi:hypothetical protein